MKNKLTKTLIFSTALAFSVGAVSLFNKPQQLFAVAHEDNYDAYTYSGDYYAFVSNSLTEGLHGTLRTTLSSLIFPEDWYTYSGAQAGQLGSVLQSADEDPTNSSNMVLFYTRDSVSKRKSGDGTGNWNREHVWPRSLSNGNWRDSNGNGKTYAGTDILHVRPTWYDTNSARGNLRYGDLNHVGVQKYKGMTYGYISGSYFEPIDSVKGDVARILMYVWTAYYDYYKDSGLVITKTIESYDTLLKWHTLDKPDALEGSRNDFSESSNQKNRNPFVDHPEYAWKIFGGEVSTDVKEACKAAYPDNDPAPSENNSSNPETSVFSEPTGSISSENAETSCINYDSSSNEVEISSVQPTSEPTPDKKSAGCNGSVIGVASLTGISALVGLVFVFSKKKE